MSIEHPVALIACGVVAALWAVVDTVLRVRRGTMRPWRSAARLCIFALLAAAAAGLVLMRPGKTIARVVVLDRSASTLTDEASALAVWQSVIADLRAEDRVALVLFGARPSVEISLNRCANVPRLSAFRSLIDASQTDIAAALALAGTLLPDDAVKQVVLVSDGRATHGDAWREASRLLGIRARLWTLPVGPDSIDDARIVLFNLPSSARLGEPVELRVAATSTFQARRTLEIRDGANQLLAQQALAFLPSSAQQMVLTVRQTLPGLHTYVARIVEPDDVPQNNERRASTWVAGEVLVQYIRTAQDRLGERTVSQMTNVAVRASSPQQVQPGELLTADLVVLDDIPIEQISARFMEELARAVMECGTGLVVLGGPNSYGPGGYAGSALEKLLPVWCDPRPEPGTTLVIVLDKSGSMADTVAGETKFRMAQQAVLVAASTLRPEDELAVIVFDVNPTLLVPAGSQRREVELERVISAVLPSGGTALGPALEMAIELASTSLKPDRHILVLSDGKSLPFDAGEILRRCREAHLAISIVASGQDADIPLLSALATNSGGRFYRSEALADLREIFSQEARFSMRSLIRKGPAAVRIAEAELVRGISASQAPPVDAYLLTKQKHTADSALSTESDAPLLAFWTVGLGRVVALTSSADADWLGSWVKQGVFTHLMNQIVRWAARPVENGKYVIEAHYGQGRLFLLAGRAQGEESERVTHVQAEVFSPTGTYEAFLLTRTGVNRFEGLFDPPVAGAYVVRLRLSENDGSVTTVGTAAVEVPSSTEWEVVGADRQTLASLAAATGGRMLAAGESPADARRTAAKRSVSEWLILAAIALFIADALTR